MIQIRIDVENMCMAVSGHAGYAPVGQDIVCAAVSTLTYTLVQNLALLLCSDDYSNEIKDGYAYIKANPPDETAEACRDIFMVIANGMFMLQAKYGQYIQVEGD